MQSSIHKLSLSVTTPEVVIEGETFKIGYKVKNVGTTTIPGGRVTVEISWASLDQKVYQPILINNPLPPNVEMEENRYSQAPLMAGYTWFNVVDATASDGTSVEIYNTGGAKLWPYQQFGSGASVQILKQPLFAVRARTHEEILAQKASSDTRKALWVAVISLLVLTASQIVDWAIRIFLNK